MDAITEPSSTDVQTEVDNITVGVTAGVVGGITFLGVGTTGTIVIIVSLVFCACCTLLSCIIIIVVACGVSQRRKYKLQAERAAAEQKARQEPLEIVDSLKRELEIAAHMVEKEEEENKRR